MTSFVESCVLAKECLETLVILHHSAGLVARYRETFKSQGPIYINVGRGRVLASSNFPLQTPRQLLHPGRLLLRALAFLVLMQLTQSPSFSGTSVAAVALRT